MIQRLLVAPLLLVAAAGCQHPQTAPPPVSSAPPTLTSSPVPPPERPSHPPPPPRDEFNRVYRLDFVLTPRDPKDPSVTPTSFAFNLVENQGGEVLVGRNVPLQAAATAPPGSKEAPHVSARQDVGVKINAHVRPIAGSEDILVDVQLELSAVEGASAAGVASIRKITSRGSAVASMGKASLVTSVDDDKRHYELTITPTKIR